MVLIKGLGGAVRLLGWKGDDHVTKRRPDFDRFCDIYLYICKKCFILVFKSLREQTEAVLWKGAFTR
jgi:hypothetical protein